MNPTRDTSANRLPHALWQVVRGDPIARLVVAVFALLTVLHAAPILPPDQRALLRGPDAIDIPLFALILLACWVGLDKIENRQERRFWVLLSVAYGSWMLASVALELLDPTSSQVGFYLVIETLLAAYYTIFILAVAGQPHLLSRRRATSPALSWLAIAALIFGLFAYFVLIPVLLNVRAYEAVFPSAYLYLLLDAFLTVRLAMLASRVDSPRWRRLYSVLALTLALSFLNDLQYSELPVVGGAKHWGVPGAILWILQFVTLALAVRLRHAPSEPLVRSTPEHRPAARFAQIRERTLMIALAFPLLHFVFYAAGVLDESIRPARETSMLVWLTLMATVAVIQHRLLEASRRNLERATSSMSAEISERRQLEAQRQKFQAALEDKQEEIEARTAELERFTYVASHDLRSPLITIQGFLGVLERKLASGDLQQIAEPMKRVEDAAASMWRLLNELLELHRAGPTAGEIRELAMDELVDEVLEGLSGMIRNRGVAIETSPDMPMVRADRTRLLEVWQNLIENAVKYMGDTRTPRIEIGWGEHDGQEVFQVRDNGRGIDLQDQEKVFELFRRLDQDTQGTGVGLALARRIVERHGGRLWVESQGRGHGATFRFTLGEP